MTPKKMFNLVVPDYYKPFCRGLRSWLPGAYKETTTTPPGRDKSRYGYSVWLRHLIVASPYLKSFPKIVLELGPGDSLAVGLAALITGADKVYMVDETRFIHELQEEIQTFDNLVSLFSEKTIIPLDYEFRDIKPILESRLFPDSILTEQHLGASMERIRLEHIRNSLLNEGPSSQDKPVSYHIFEDGEAPIEPESVDMIISQAVMEHVYDVEIMYTKMYSWLKPGGLMSHMIDFQSHGITETWNGHWVYSDFQWQIITGRRDCLLNRLSFSMHLKAIREVGFNVIGTLTYQDQYSFNKPSTPYKCGKLNRTDSTITGAVIQAIKSGN